MNLPNPGRGQASESEAALRVASLRVKFIPTLEAEGFLWLICKAWIIKRTVSGVKREVQCLLKIGILAKDRRQRAKNFASARGDGQAQNAIFLAFSA